MILNNLYSDNNTSISSNHNKNISSNHNKNISSDHNNEIISSDHNNKIISNESVSSDNNNESVSSDNNNESVSGSSNDENNTSSSSDQEGDNKDNLELLGESLRHYNIIYEIGRGGYSIVWLVFNKIDKRFYALKVQNPDEFKDGLSEIKFVQKLPKEPNVFNNLIEYFIERKNDKKYLCSIWNLHATNLDTIIRKGSYILSFNLIIDIMKQLTLALSILHNKFKVFHGDIKTDNILVKGISNKNKIICEKYLEMFNDNNHKEITNKILEETSNISLHDFNLSDKINISLADFGFYCDANSQYNESFGTRYYQAPEIILMGSCSYPVDIWALGCTFFELLTGNILFDPNKDSQYSRDYYHLCLINETCGKFPSSFLNKTKYYKNYFSYKNEIKDFKINNFNRLDRKLKDTKNKFTDNQINIIKTILNKILIIDYNKRGTIKDISIMLNNI